MKGYFLKSVMFVIAGSAIVFSEATGELKTTARNRNQQIANRARPDERAAILALTEFGCNIILDDSNSVQSVHLSGCVFPDSKLVMLRQLPKLRELKLSHTHISNASLVHLERLSHLESLQLTQTRIGDEGLAHLTGLAGLKSLNLHQTQISDNGLKYVAG